MDTPTRLHNLTHASGTYKPTLPICRIRPDMTDGGPLLRQLLTGLNVNVLSLRRSLFMRKGRIRFLSEPNGNG
jgi:hypothetical protein